MVAAYAAFASGRAWRPAACDRTGAHGERQAALCTAQREFRPRHRPAICGDDEPDDAGDLADRDRPQSREPAGLAGRWETGTSQDWRDAWFLGYTSYLVAGVWLGNDDSSPTKKVSGGNLPVEIWSRFMKAAHEGVFGRRPAARSMAQRGSRRTPRQRHPSTSLALSLGLADAEGVRRQRPRQLHRPSHRKRESSVPEDRPGAPTTGISFRPLSAPMADVARRRTTRGC